MSHPEPAAGRPREPHLVGHPTPSRRGVIVADGRLDLAQLRLESGRPWTLVIGADGGAARARRAGARVDVVVGDLDSISGDELAALRAGGAEVLRAEPDKDESDAELAVLAAIDRELDPLVILGALGGARIDHEVANLLLLGHPRLDGRDVTLLDGSTTVRRIGTEEGPGTIELEGAVGDLVTLLPIAGAVIGVTTRGLRYPLRAEALLPGPARGLSNQLLGSSAAVATARGRLLVIHIRDARTEDTP